MLCSKVLISFNVFLLPLLKLVNFYNRELSVPRVLHYNASFIRHHNNNNYYQQQCRGKLPERNLSGAVAIANAFVCQT